MKFKIQNYCTVRTLHIITNIRTHTSFVRKRTHTFSCTKIYTHTYNQIYTNAQRAGAKIKTKKIKLAKKVTVFIYSQAQIRRSNITQNQFSSGKEFDPRGARVESFSGTLCRFFPMFQHEE